MSEEKKARWYHLRKSFLAVLALILLAIFVVAWWYHLPMGSGPAGPKVAAQPFNSVWHEGQVLFVGMGDSITTGFGAGGSAYGYFNLLLQTPADDVADMKGKNLSKVFPNAAVVNLATNSSSSGLHLRSQLPQLAKQTPAVMGIIFLTTGGIDLIHSYGSYPPRDEAIYGASYSKALEFGKKFRQRLEQLLDGIKQKFPGGCHIFLGNIYDPTDGVGDIQNVHPLLRLVKKLPPWPDGLKVLALWNRHLKEAAAAKDFVHLVDIHGVMLGHGIHCRDKNNPYYDPEDPYYWYYINLEDPNRRGYDAVRRAFLNTMIPVFYKEQKE